MVAQVRSSYGLQNIKKARSGALGRDPALPSVLVSPGLPSNASSSILNSDEVQIFNQYQAAVDRMALDMEDEAMDGAGASHSDSQNSQD